MKRQPSLIPLLSLVLAACQQPSDLGVTVERITGDDWAERFADDPSARLISMPPGISPLECWHYQFGGNGRSTEEEVSAAFLGWAGKSNMECGPAVVSAAECMAGRDAADCGYQESVAGCAGHPATHSACRGIGVCEVSSGYTPSSASGTRPEHLAAVLGQLGHTVHATYDGSRIGGSAPPQYRRLTLAGIQSAIDADRVVIAGVNACAYKRELGLGTCATSHWVAVYGYSDAWIYLLDPGYRNGRRGRVSRDAFSRALSGGNYWGVVASRPGFDRFPNASWYPPGSLLRAGGEYYYSVWRGGRVRLLHASPEALAANRIPVSRAIAVSDSVIACLEHAGEMDTARRFREYRQGTTVYLVDLTRRTRHAFLRYEAYTSWAGHDEWLHTTAAEQASWERFPEGEPLGIAPGTLVGLSDASTPTVWVMSTNDAGLLRLPIFDELTARVFGLDVSAVDPRGERFVRVPAAALSAVTGRLGETLRIEMARDCRGEMCVSADACFELPAAGGSTEPVWGEDGSPPCGSEACIPGAPEHGSPDVIDSDGDGAADREDCAPADASVHRGAPELCDGVDNDCNGIPDDSVPEHHELGPCGTTVRGCRGGYWVLIEGRDPSPELCNGGDDDCDGTADEGCSGPVPEDLLVNGGFELPDVLEPPAAYAEDFGWNAWRAVEGLGSCERAHAPGGAWEGVYLVRCEPTFSASARAEWEVALVQLLRTPLVHGHRYQLTFRARAALQRTIWVSVQQHLGPDSHGLSAYVRLGAEWSRYEHRFTANLSSGGASKLMFGLGAGTVGPIDFDDIALVDLGP